jgi:hypothetical protein
MGPLWTAGHKQLHKWLHIQLVQKVIGNQWQWATNYSLWWCCEKSLILVKVFNMCNIKMDPAVSVIIIKPLLQAILALLLFHYIPLWTDMFLWPSELWTKIYGYWHVHKKSYVLWFYFSHLKCSYLVHDDLIQVSPNHLLVECCHSEKQLWFSKLSKS